MKVVVKNKVYDSDKDFIYLCFEEEEAVILLKIDSNKFSVHHPDMTDEEISKATKRAHKLLFKNGIDKFSK